MSARPAPTPVTPLRESMLRITHTGKTLAPARDFQGRPLRPPAATDTTPRRRPRGLLATSAPARAVELLTARPDLRGAADVAETLETAVLWNA